MSNSNPLHPIDDIRLPLTQIPHALKAANEEIETFRRALDATETEARRLIKANAALELANRELIRQGKILDDANRNLTGRLSDLRRQAESEEVHHTNFKEAIEKGRTFENAFCMSCEDEPVVNFLTDLCDRCDTAGDQ
jgi:vacuolar-type H+-ATPase subunit E/Vma4